MKSVQFKKDIIQFILIIGILFFANFFASDISLRWDLTEDQRYSVAQETKEALDKIKGDVRIEVFLEGDMPASYSQLARGIKEKLQDLNVYSGGKLDVEFIDPFDGADSTKRLMQNFLKERGIKPVVVQKKEQGKVMTKALYPAVTITQNGISIGVNLLKKGKITQSGKELGEINREDIEQTLNSLEFELVNGLKSTTVEGRQSIGFLAGHGELDYYELKDVERRLQEYYNLFIYNLDSLNQNTLNKLDLLIIARPQTKFSDLDKYKIDQYLLQGGNIICFVDALKSQRTTEGEGLLAIPYELNMRDLLFSWGVRINNEIVLDLESTGRPIEVEGSFKVIPSTFTPRITNFNKSHKITKDLKALAVENFIGSLDTTTSSRGVNKTPLFFTSQYARVWQAPVTITGYDISHPVLKKEVYTHSNLPLAYLLEGTFKSFFKNKPIPKGGADSKLDLSQIESKVLVVGDGGMIANTLSADGKTYKPAGYATYDRIQYQNLIFLNNAIDYMLHKDFITQKGIGFMARPLDKIKIKDEKTSWQAINLVVPNVVVILFGIVFLIIRKRRFTRF